MCTNGVRMQQLYTYIHPVALSYIMLAFEWVQLPLSIHVVKRQCFCVRCAEGWREEEQ